VFTPKKVITDDTRSVAKVANVLFVVAVLFPVFEWVLPYGWGTIVPLIVILVCCIRILEFYASKH
jgi:uncharacterized membrane protein